MKLNLSTFLAALPGIGSAAAALPEVYNLLKGVADSFTKPTDQATAREAIEDLAADNDEGHARLQDKLAAAAKE